MTTTVEPAATTGRVTGTVAPGFEAVRGEVERHAAADPTWTSQLAVLVGDELVVDLQTGPRDGALAGRWLVPVFSCTKGWLAVVVGTLVQDGRLDLDERVAAYWPEFGAAGKGRVTVRQLLSHQAGLPGLRGGYGWEEMVAHAPLAERLAAARPLWEPGTAHGYHALTVGTLGDELLRRVTGRTAGDLLADLTRPRDVDVHLGIPSDDDRRERLVPVQMPTTEELAPYAQVLGAVLAPARGSLSASTGLQSDLPLFVRVNEPRMIAAGQAAAGGVASALGLARFYAGLRHDLGAPAVLSQDVVEQLSAQQVRGQDEVAPGQTRFGVLFMLPREGMELGSALAFGHDGAGGGLGLFDPVYDMSLGYTVQRIPLPGGADRRALGLAATVRSCL